MAKKKNSTSGSNTSHRRMTKAERRTFGEEHAPAVINKPSDQCLLCQKDTILTKPYGYMRLCDDCIAEVCWHEVKNYIDGRIVKATLFCDAWEYFEKNRDQIKRVMHPDFWHSYVRQCLFDYFDDWLEIELFYAEDMATPILSWKKERGWDGFGKAYLSSLGIDAKHITVGWLGSDLIAMKRYRYSMVLAGTDFYKKAKPIRENEEVIEEAFTKKMEGKGLARLDELFKAIEYAVTHWNTEPQAQKLFDGYRLHISPGIPTSCFPPMLPRPNQRWQWVILSNKEYPSPLVVGFKDENADDPRLVVKRSDIRDFMLKVNAGPILHHPSLGQTIENGRPRSVSKAQNKKAAKVPSSVSKVLSEVPA